jgi:hypothetical protein
MCGVLGNVRIKSVLYGVCIVISKEHFDWLMLFGSLFRVLLNKFVLLLL